MKDTYPNSNIWPYILSVLVLIGIVLAPPTEWLQTVRTLYSQYSTLLAENVPEDGQLLQAERVVVAFDPNRTLPTPTAPPQTSTATEILTADVAQRVPSTSETNEQLTFNSAVQKQSNSWNDQPIPSAPAPVDLPAQRNVAPTRANTTLPMQVAPKLNHQTANRIPPNSTAATKTSSSAESLPYVWQPPEGWVPSLIRPLSPGEQLTAVPSTNQPTTTLAQTQPQTLRPTLPQTSLREQRPRNARVQDVPPPAQTAVWRSDVQPPVSRRPLSPSWSRRPTTKVKVPTFVAQAEDRSPTTTANTTTTANASPAASSPVQSAETQTLHQRIIPDRWPSSPVLDELLQTAREDKVLRNWSIEISKAVAIVQGKRATGAADQVKVVARLRELASMQVDRSLWPEVHRSLHDQVRLAVLRRVDIWQPLMAVAYTEPTSFATYRARKELLKEAQRIEAKLGASAETADWIQYLGLQKIENTVTDAVGNRALAETLLARLHSPMLTKDQRAFLRSQDFAAYESHLRNVIAKSVHPAEIMQALEDYETRSNRTTSNKLIQLMQRWRSAPNGQMYRPAIDAIVAYYRNANLRISISEELINRFVPAFRQYAEQVNDRILGADVTGRSRTRSNVAVKLLPDPNGIRLGLLAAGQVQSNTSSRKGPVTMFNRGQSSFAAGKEVIVRQNGIFTSPAEARATSGNRLIRIETDWDDVPIVGRIVRSVAQQEIDEQRGQVEAQMQMRVKQQAQQRIDTEFEKRVTKAGQNLDRNIVDPLRRMELDPQAMEMRTTNDRVIMRTRLASPWQFAAHTPRPQIRADSKMSVQIHQSAANNIIEQLQLQGRRMTLEEFVNTLSERFGFPLQVAYEDHKDAILQFGEHPLEFEFSEGQITLTIHFAELKSGRRSWKDFSIRGYYRADIQKLAIELEREDGISLIGDRIGLRDQLALRSIFTKVLAKHTRLQILRTAIQQQPQLSNLSVTQFTIRDGWLALAFGERTETAAERMTARSHGRTNR